MASEIWANPDSKDIAMIRRSFKEGWNTAPEKRQQIIEMLYNLATAEGGNPRNKIAATKALLAADRCEQGWEELELKKKALEDGNNVSVLAVVADIQASNGE